MVTVMVLFNLPESMKREDFIAHSRITAAHWNENAQLLHKTYLYDPQMRQGGAVFLWQDKAAAESAHNDTWRQQIIQFYGSAPAVHYFEAPLMIARSERHGIIEESA